MGYEDSAACKMLATHCSACARPLVDAVSVEIGMGPDCRKKYFKDPEGITPEERSEANVLVYKIALLQKGVEVINATNALRNMGFAALADRIADRLAAVVVKEDGAVLAVYTPYDEKTVWAMKKIPGRKWDKEKKANVFPLASKAAIWLMMKKNFKGLLGYGKNGLFVIEGA